MGISSLPFLLRAHLIEPVSRRYLDALLYARLRSGRLANCERLLQECEARTCAEDWAHWRDWLLQAQKGLDPASLGLPAPSIDHLFDCLDNPGQPFNPARSSARHQELASYLAAGLQQFNDGQCEALLSDLEPLVERYPDWGEGHHLCGVAYSVLSRRDRAVVSLVRASELMPGRADIFDQLAMVWAGLGDHERAEGAFEQSLALAPLRAESWNNASDTALSRENYEAGYQYAILAMRLDPSLPQPLLNLGRALVGMGNLDEAQRVLGYLVQANPGHSMAEQKLGDICLMRGDYQAADRHFQRAIDAKPDNAGAMSSVLFLKHFLNHEDRAASADMARRYGALIARNARALTTWHNPRRPDKQLRVGFVSGDFGDHPVGHFLVSVLESLSTSPNLVLLGFPTAKRQGDLADRIRNCFSNWIPLYGLDDDEAALRVGSESIDILIDLSGHTGAHRLELFARKPAPVQVSWLGYFATTGVAQIDYLLAGPWDVPPVEETWYVEKIWRLPTTRLCFSRPAYITPVAPLPALTNGVFTLGCFNKLIKLNDAVIELWSRILMENPDARLFLKAAELGGEQARIITRKRFACHGVEPERLILEGPSPLPEYLAAYHRVDLALDPFPYTGGTTSIQALWMGVPVLTMAGQSMLSRQGESMLRALGLDDWVATDPWDYQAKAQAKVADLASLATLRASLRGQVEASPLMNARLFAHDLEDAFRAMWRGYCSAAPGAEQAHLRALDDRK